MSSTAPCWPLYPPLGHGRRRRWLSSFLPTPVIVILIVLVLVGVTFGAAASAAGATPIATIAVPGPLAGRLSAAPGGSGTPPGGPEPLYT